MALREISGILVKSAQSVKGRSSLINSFWGFRRSEFKGQVQFTRSLHQFQIALSEAQAVISISDTSGEMASPIPKAQSPGRMKKPPGIISPPFRKGMLTLDREAFDKDIKIPTVYVYEDSINPQTLQKFKRFMLKIQGMKPVSEAAGSEEESKGDQGISASTARKRKKIFINPELVKGQDLTRFVEHEVQADPTIVSSVGYETVKFKYDNWTLGQIMEAILPDDEDKVSGFSQIGHIIHVNLRDHILPYKSLIGEIFLDKIKNAKTVVNKINIIESTYRNFQMELLAGDPNTVVAVKENRCEFEFDFATVYWNPRLSSEHDKLVKVLESGEVLYDVFAGVGPFTIPAAKRKINVLANDLNPNSFKWLEHNVKKNKAGNFVQCFNLDGRAFIQETASKDLRKRLQDGSIEKGKRFHFAMNLPALAVEFLDAFWGILNNFSDTSLIENNVIVHVYCFIKDVEGFKDKALKLVEDCLGCSLPVDNIIEVAFVRNVAPNKEMMRVSFSLPVEVLVGNTKEKVAKRKFCEIDEVDQKELD